MVFCRSIITAQLDAQQRIVLKALHDVVARENRPYYTENDHYYEAYYTKWLWHYRHVNENAYRYKLGVEYDTELDSVSIRSSSPIMLQVAAHEPPPSASKYDDEMRVMASVRAYVQVAYKVCSLHRCRMTNTEHSCYFKSQRIIDHVPRTIQRDLSQFVVDGLEGRLLEELKLGEANASQRLQDLLVEDPKVSTRRKRLADTKRVLGEVISALNTYVV